MVADNPERKIELKAFHCEILNDHESLKEAQECYKEIPVIRKLNNAIIQRSYWQIKQDVQDIVQSQMERLLNDPGMKYLIIRKGGWLSSKAVKAGLRGEDNASLKMDHVKVKVDGLTKNL